MPKFDFCLPTLGKAVPAGPEWFHEIKFDGYRLRVERDGDSVRLITRGGYDWTKRFPRIVEAALNNRRKQFVIDGEAVQVPVHRPAKGLGRQCRLPQHAEIDQPSARPVRAHELAEQRLR
jgi:ATP-dependent DNA ligase